MTKSAFENDPEIIRIQHKIGYLYIVLYGIGNIAFALFVSFFVSVSRATEATSLNLILYPLVLTFGAVLGGVMLLMVFESRIQDREEEIKLQT